MYIRRMNCKHFTNTSKKGDLEIFLLHRIEPGKLQPTDQIQTAPIFLNKPLLEHRFACIYILSVAALGLHQQSWEVPTQTIWLVKPKIFIVCPFTENVFHPLTWKKVSDKCTYLWLPATEGIWNIVDILSVLCCLCCFLSNDLVIGIPAWVGASQREMRIPETHVEGAWGAYLENLVWGRTWRKGPRKKALAATEKHSERGSVSVMWACFPILTP